MNLPVTFFQDVRAMHGVYLDMSWDGLTDALCQFRETCCLPCVGSRCDQKKGMLWAPVRTFDNDRRHVDAVSALVYDLDNISPEDLQGLRLRLAEVRYFMHSTHSYTPERPSARLVLPLERELAPDAAKRAYSAVGERYELADDAQGFNARRIFYMPSCPAGSRRLIVDNTGTRLLAL